MEVEVAVPPPQKVPKPSLRSNDEKVFQNPSTRNEARMGEPVFPQSTLETKTILSHCS